MVAHVIAKDASMSSNCPKFVAPEQLGHKLYNNNNDNYYNYYYYYYYYYTLGPHSVPNLLLHQLFEPLEPHMLVSVPDWLYGANEQSTWLESVKYKGERKPQREADRQGILFDALTVNKTDAFRPPAMPCVD